MKLSYGDFLFNEEEKCYLRENGDKLEINYLTRHNTYELKITSKSGRIYVYDTSKNLTLIEDKINIFLNGEKGLEESK